MKRYTNPNKNLIVVEILKKICSTVDPNAFIAGGYSAELALGYNRNSVPFDPDIRVGEGDVDIFFKHPIYDPFDNWANEDATELLTSIFPGSFSRANLETYYYHYDIRRLGKLYYKGVYFDFIQYDKEKYSHNIIDGFDLDECKVITELSNYKSDKPYLVTQTTPDFNRAWKTKEVKPHLDMLQHSPANDIQNEKTLKRAKKWEQIKQHYLGN